MGKFHFSDRRFLSAVASIGLLLGMIAPALVTSFASAAEITTRSVDMSSSAISATSVSYTVDFTPVTTAAGYVIDFCDNTPLVGNSCTKPPGMSLTGVGTDTPSTTAVPLTTSGEEGALVTTALTAGDANSVELTGITNPNYQTSSAADDGFYARIVTYATGNMPTASAATNSTPGTLADSGGVALSTTSAFEAEGSVLETMTFCVSGTDTSVSADPNCTGTLSTPTLNLGTNDGGTYVLSNNASSPSTGTVYTQLSTNAVGGAVVSLKSSATGCGGLINVESDTDCIAPLASGFSTGVAGFGLETGESTATPTTSDTSATGVIDPETGYSDSAYHLAYASNNTTGVTSPYGSPILDSNGAPINDENMPVVFGAASNANTPAGNYQATLNMVADGSF